MLAPAQPLATATSSQEAFATALGEVLVEQGLLDSASLDRGRRVASDTNSRLDKVLPQLGLVSERALAEATARLLGLKLAAPADYPAEAILPERLRLKFLRKSRAIPIALDDRTITLAMADPLDRFVASSIGVVAQRSVDIRVAVPVDLETAFARIYGDEDAPAQADFDA